MWGANDIVDVSPGEVSEDEMTTEDSVADGNAHVASGALDDPHGGVNTGAIEVGELGLGDLLELGPTDLPVIALG